MRVFYAHALVAAPRLALGRLAPLGRLLGDPRRGGVDLFLSIRRVFPERYPLTGVTLDELLALEHPVFRAVDYGVIVPRMAALFAFEARSLADVWIDDLVHDGVPAYVWPADLREPWLGGSRTIPVRLLTLVTGARTYVT